MKKSLIGGIAALAVVAGGTAAFALTAGGQEPVAPPATTSTTTAEPTASATPEPSAVPTDEPVPSAYPSADEDAFLALVHRDWQGTEVPADSALVAAGYEACSSLPEVDDDRFPEWDGLDNLAVHFAAGAALCPGVE